MDDDLDLLRVMLSMRPKRTVTLVDGSSITLDADGETLHIRDAYGKKIRWEEVKAAIALLLEK
jgi:hypothetical protein